MNVRLLRHFSIKVALKRLNVTKNACSFGWRILCWCWRCRACRLSEESTTASQRCPNLGKAEKVGHNFLAITCFMLVVFANGRAVSRCLSSLVLARDSSTAYLKTLGGTGCCQIKSWPPVKRSNNEWSQASVACRLQKTARNQIAEKRATKNWHEVPHVQTHDCQHPES